MQVPHYFIAPTASLKLRLLSLRWKFDAMQAFQTPLDILAIGPVVRPIMTYHQSAWIFPLFSRLAVRCRKIRPWTSRKAVLWTKLYVPHLFPLENSLLLDAFQLGGSDQFLEFTRAYQQCRSRLNRASVH